MANSARGLPLTRLLAVLFGVLLLWPAAQSRIGTQPRAVASAGDESSPPVGDLDTGVASVAELDGEEDPAPGSSAEGGSGVVPAHRIAPPPAVAHRTDVALAAPAASAVRRLARERGPPMS